MISTTDTAPADKALSRTSLMLQVKPSNFWDKFWKSLMVSRTFFFISNCSNIRCFRNVASAFKLPVEPKNTSPPARVSFPNASIDFSPKPA